MRYSFTIILLGIGLIALSVLLGETQVMLFLIFPVFYGTSVLMLIGALAVIVGMFLLFYEFTRKFEEAKYPKQEVRIKEKYPPEKKVKGGGVVLIGPLPIIFGTDVGTAKLLIILAIILVVIVSLVYLFILL